MKLRRCDILYAFTLVLQIKYIISIDEEKHKKAQQGHAIAQNILMDLYVYYEQCLGSSMHDKKFLTDDIHSLINSQAKTTIGLGPKFTSNRKFFANLLSHPAFKEMIARDEKSLWNDLRRKVQFCQGIVMDKNILKEFYDREVDPSKI